MKLLVLGTRGEIESSLPYHSKHSGILIDDVLMLDVGEKAFLKYKPKWIFITHLHPDHAFFAKEKVGSAIPMYAPEEYKDDVKVQVLKKPVKVGSYKVTPIPTHHSKRVKSCAYLVQKGKKRILYTGDLVWLDKKYHKLFGKLDLVICEASFLRKGGLIKKDKETGKIYGHNGVPDFMRLFKDYTDKMLFVHFGTWFFKDTKKGRRKLIQLGQEYGLKVVVGYDGIKISL